jgi:ABC-type phosphate/phosphonate transport system substrate-binding protein
MRWCALVGAITLVLLLGRALGFAPADQPNKLDTLRIGSSSTLNEDIPESVAATLRATLAAYIHSKTSLETEIVPEKSYEDLAAKLDKGHYQVGMFTGFEFAWVHNKYPKLLPVAIAVNGQRHRYAYVFVRHDSKITEFAGLKGQTIALPLANEPFLRLYVHRQTQVQIGEAPKTFFGQITTPGNMEAALDDVVDGSTQAAVIDRIGLEAYQRRKPGRFNQLKELTKSRPCLSPVVASCEGNIDPATLRRFLDSLLNTDKKKVGQTLPCHRHAASDFLMPIAPPKGLGKLPVHFLFFSRSTP